MREILVSTCTLALQLLTIAHYCTINTNFHTNPPNLANPFYIVKTGNNKNHVAIPGAILKFKI
jgi:hypothetical protein